MKVFQFHLKDRSDGIRAFDTEPNCIAYTGTHDNNTIRGWYEQELSESEQLHIRRMLDLDDDVSPENWYRPSSPTPTAVGLKRSSCPCRTCWPSRQKLG